MREQDPKDRIREMSVLNLIMVIGIAIGFGIGMLIDNVIGGIAIGVLGGVYSIGGGGGGEAVVGLGSSLFYSRLSPKIAFLMSFSCSKTKRATIALRMAVEGSLILVADFNRSSTLFKLESIYTVARRESRIL